MVFQATVRLRGNALELFPGVAGVPEIRKLSFPDHQLFSQWSERYRALSKAHDPAPEFLKLGTEMFEWLNVKGQFLRQLTNGGTVPLLIQFQMDRVDELAPVSFLNAPWELLADNGRHWALRPDTLFCPVRVIGESPKPRPKSETRLSLVFMAAAPRGLDNLQFELEEASILSATQKIGLDLVVEESGTLQFLSACVAREKPEIIHISCHGTSQPEPGLLLEDDGGDPSFVTASGLIGKLANHHPRLLFLSACESAETQAARDTLAGDLVRSGAPAVLGWAAPVYDTEARIFAAALYGHLAAEEDLAHAVAYARRDLRESEELGSRKSRDWHLARLYLSPSGGGVLASVKGKSRFQGRGQATKAFLDAEGKRVPVANESEFVGRRRQIQAVLRDFAAPEGQRHAGVLIHGMGGQGKSSLAARVAQRMEHTCKVILLYERYDAVSILGAFRDGLGSPAVDAIVKRHIETAETSLYTALMELLEGPCQQRDGMQSPVLLIVDDFEQALDLESPVPHALQPLLVEPIRAVIRAFRKAGTQSRLLFTSRFQFSLPDGSADLAKRLLSISLPGMDPHESEKQAATAWLRRGKNAGALHGRMKAIQTAAMGNPGLQNLLFSLCLEEPALCDSSLAQMEQFHQSGKAPTEAAVRDFLEDLAVRRLLELLTPQQRELLRASTIFAFPVPESVMQRLAGRGERPPGVAGMERIAALGLWETYEDLHRASERAVAINSLVRPFAGSLGSAEEAEVAGLVTTELFERWGGESGGRSSRQDLQLTELGLLAEEPKVLAASGARALRYLDQQFQYRRAATMARQVMEVLDAALWDASVDLLRTAAGGLHQVGEVKEATFFLERALTRIDRMEKTGTSANPWHHGATLIANGRALVEQGQPDKALTFFEKALTLAQGDRERAIVLADIARLREGKGEVEAALGSYKEMLGIFEWLGDTRSLALAMGDIARLRARTGEVDAALTLHLERLVLLEGLGDTMSRAATLGDVARLRADKGEVDAALALHTEELAVYEALGAARSRAVTFGDIARLRSGKGEVDAALALHKQALIVYEELGDTRSKAVALGDIARLRAGVGELEEALRLHKERLTICETLGDRRERAVALGDIAQVRAAKGEMELAVGLLKEKLAIVETIGDQDGIANTLWSIANISQERGDHQEAFEFLIRSYEINLKLGRLEGICFVGLDLGSLLCEVGQAETGRTILIRSRDGFLRLGQRDNAEYAQSLMDRWPEASS